MAKKSKKKATRSTSAFPFAEMPTRETAGKTLKILARKLGGKAFALHYCTSSPPSFTLCLALDEHHAAEHATPLAFSSGSAFGQEREVRMVDLDTIYLHSPIKFKERVFLSLNEFAYWMRRDIADIELRVWDAIVNELSLDIALGHPTRVWQGMKWVDVDPWELAVEVDLA